MKIPTPLDRDSNRQIISSNEAFRLESTWTFAASTTGAIGAHTAFTVTDNVLLNIWGVCDTDLAGATATIEAGTANNTAALIAQTTGTNIDDGEIWQNATPTAEVGAALGNAIPINDGANIILTIGTAALTGGVIDLYCLWRPLTENSNVVVTTPA